MYSLLLMADWATQISDIITDKWPEILAILTSSTFAFFLFQFIVKLILIKVEGNAKKKYETPMIEKFNTLKDKYEQSEKEMQAIFDSFVLRLEEVLNKAKEQELKAKQEFYDEVVGKIEIPDLEVEQITLETPPKTNEEEKTEQVIEETPKIESTPQKTNKTVVKKVIKNE